MWKWKYINEKLTQKKDKRPEYNKIRALSPATKSYLWAGRKGASVAITRESPKHMQSGETGRGPGGSPDGAPVTGGSRRDGGTCLHLPRLHPTCTCVGALRCLLRAACPQPAAHQAPQALPPCLPALPSRNPVHLPHALFLVRAPQKERKSPPRGQALASSPLFCGCLLLPTGPFPGSSQFHSFQRLPRLQICPPDTTAKNMHS